VASTSLPNEVQPLYETLNSELIWIHAKWQLYRQVFAGSPEDIDLLNRTAPFFFRVVQRTLFEDVLISICRLADPSATVGKQNFSLAQLLDRIEHVAPATLLGKLTTLLGQIDTGSSTFREWRNRRIAHSDLSTALKVSEEVLPGISRQDIELVLSPMRDFMNEVSAHYSASEMAYDHFISVSGGDVLLRLLYKADAEQRDERERKEREFRAMIESESA